MVIFHGRGNPSGIPKQSGLWHVLFSEPKGSGKGVLEKFAEEKNNDLKQQKLVRIRKKKLQRTVGHGNKREPQVQEHKTRLSSP